VGVWSMGLPTYRPYMVGRDHHDTIAHDVLQLRLLRERPSHTHMQLHETGYPTLGAQDELSERLVVSSTLSP